MSTQHESRARSKDRVANPSRVGNEFGGRPGHLSWIVGGVASAIVVGGIAYKTIGGGDSDAVEKSPFNTEPGVSAPAVPGPSEGTSSEETENLETPETPTALNYEALKDDPQGIADGFMELRSQWINSGFSLEAAKSEEAAGMSNDEFGAKLAQATDQSYIDAIMVPGWENNPKLVEFVENDTKIHENVIKIKLGTTNPKYGDKEVYERGFSTFEGSASFEESAEPGTLVAVSVESKEGDNSPEMNAGAEQYENGFDPDNVVGHATWVFEVVDGELKLADFRNLAE